MVESSSASVGLRQVDQGHAQPHCCRAALILDIYSAYYRYIVVWQCRDDNICLVSLGAGRLVLIAFLP
jgi:hypothetical protein